MQQDQQVSWTLCKNAMALTQKVLPTALWSQFKSVRLVDSLIQLAICTGLKMLNPPLSASLGPFGTQAPVKRRLPKKIKRGPRNDWSWIHSTESRAALPMLQTDLHTFTRREGLSPNWTYNHNMNLQSRTWRPWCSWIVRALCFHSKLDGSLSTQLCFKLDLITASSLGGRCELIMHQKTKCCTSCRVFEILWPWNVETSELLLWWFQKETNRLNLQDSYRIRKATNNIEQLRKGSRG